MALDTGIPENNLIIIYYDYLYDYLSNVKLIYYIFLTLDMKDSKFTFKLTNVLRSSRPAFNSVSSPDLLEPNSERKDVIS